MQRNNVLAFAACCVISLLCACGSPNPTATPPVSSGASAFKAIPDKSTAKAVLLVTDDATNESYIIAYPSGKVLHTLPGTSEPQGVCSDGDGHFWIANTGDENVIEYSSDGKNLGTLSDPNNFPVGCAYDPKTGDLAVTNIVSTSDSPGSVAIYTKAKGSPKLYMDASLNRVFFLAYEASTGTLVVDGENSSYDFAMASLANGKFKVINLKSATIEFPGPLAYSTKIRSMNVEDQEAAIMYHFELNGKVTGTTTITGSGSPYAIFGGTLLTATGQSMGQSAVDVYSYPAGGAPKKIIPVSVFSEVNGLAVSSAVTE